MLTQHSLFLLHIFQLSVSHCTLPQIPLETLLVTPTHVVIAGLPLYYSIQHVDLSIMVPITVIPPDSQFCYNRFSEVIYTLSLAGTIAIALGCHEKCWVAQELEREKVHTKYMKL